MLFLAAGTLELHDGVDRLSVGTRPALLLIDPNTSVDLVKTPAGSDTTFRSVLLEISTPVLASFAQADRAMPARTDAPAPFREVELNDDLSATLGYVFESVGVRRVSDARLRYRLMDLLSALSESGHFFTRLDRRRTADRLREIIGEAPEQRWTAHRAGHALAMSEATLRRRLASERTRFDELLVDVRMHHAMMLLQTTAWSIPHVAEACGYRSRARFSDRFRTRFGYPPSAVR